ncbi:MAG: hypothetical protein MUC49_14515 [Raineya sp.]|jgi:hypothetical protein|nr:hypothetical protein [Raineya sp.]
MEYMGNVKSDVYIDYGGESVNIRKFREALDAGMTREEAAFETVTGKWAKEKRFDKVRFFGELGSEICDKNNRVEVIFYK